MKKSITKKDFSCGGFVWNEQKEKVLMVHVQSLTGRRVWTFPKGHPERGETKRRAAEREVWEETGWKCRTIRPLTTVRYLFVRDGIRFHKSVLWYLMAPEKKTGRFDPEEILACRWFSIDEAASRISYATDRRLIRMVVARLNRKPVRSR